jgi:COP9 signalosome complex subunit 2
LENCYYKTKGIRSAWLDSQKTVQLDYDDALTGYREVVSACTNPPEDGAAVRSEEDMDLGFKSLKQIIKMYLDKADYPQLIETYTELLQYMKDYGSRMSQGRSYTDGSIQKMIERVSQQVTDQPILARFFSETVTIFETTGNPKQAFKTKIKLGEVYHAAGNFIALEKIIETLERSCQNEAGEDDIAKGGQLFDVFKLKFPMLASQRRTKEMKREYKRAVELSTKVVADGRVMGLIREEGGKMHLAEGQWKTAYEDYFEAFKCYEEMGDSRRLSCLKMLVLANMLDESEIDPFAAPEAQPYVVVPSLGPLAIIPPLCIVRRLIWQLAAAQIVPQAKGDSAIN